MKFMKIYLDFSNLHDRIFDAYHVAVFNDKRFNKIQDYGFRIVLFYVILHYAIFVDLGPIV